jgi:hypothetical protein
VRRPRRERTAASQRQRRGVRPRLLTPVRARSSPPGRRPAPASVGSRPRFPTLATPDRPFEQDYSRCPARSRCWRPKWHPRQKSRPLVPYVPKNRHSGRLRGARRPVRLRRGLERSRAPT